MFGGSRHARQRLAIHGVAVAAEITGDADFGMAGNREIWVDDDPATAIEFATRGLRQLLPQVRWLHAGGPDHRCRLDPNVSIGPTDHNLPRPHGLDAALRHVFDAIAFEVFEGCLRELRWHRSQHPVTGIHQNDPRFLGIQLLEGIL